MLIFFTPTECSLHSSRKLTERPTQILSGARSLALVLVCLSFPMAEVFYINKNINRTTVIIIIVFGGFKERVI